MTRSLEFALASHEFSTRTGRLGQASTRTGRLGQASTRTGRFGQLLRCGFLGLALCAISACGAAEADTCAEVRSTIAYDAPGPWYATPRDLTDHVEGWRAGKLLWALGGDTTVVVRTTLDTESATAIDRVLHEGKGDHDHDDLLACTDSVTMTAALEVTTADGGLQETLTVELEATQGFGVGFVDGWVDLSHHDFAGPLSWQPGDDSSQVFLRLRWIADDPQTLRGWLVWGDASAVEIDDSKIVGEGVGQVIAQFETTHQPDPDHDDDPG